MKLPRQSSITISYSSFTRGSINQTHEQFSHLVNRKDVYLHAC
ncbi:hypothetical protein LSAJ156_290052 [Latilactobacillus sakei]|nr:hypothetical protein LSAJ160_160043 [Latilactobacillus sakei]SOB38673.1 hypothetical protein LSAJ156_290052 [Latilactobacillus sakei]SON65433.1 protein of unknown function [Latilactobacillus sakei]SON69522.1 protein of unknown function [Latilactobacillus sakei]SON73507.1 protein of unknown function [Latilactobacillus sakei]